LNLSEKATGKSTQDIWLKSVTSSFHCAYPKHAQVKTFSYIRNYTVEKLLLWQQKSCYRY